MTQGPRSLLGGAHARGGGALGGGAGPLPAGGRGEDDAAGALPRGPLHGEHGPVDAGARRLRAGRGGGRDGRARRGQGGERAPAQAGTGPPHGELARRGGGCRRRAPPRSPPPPARRSPPAAPRRSRPPHRRGAARRRAVVAREVFASTRTRGSTRRVELLIGVIAMEPGAPASPSLRGTLRRSLRRRGGAPRQRALGWTAISVGGASIALTTASSPACARAR